MMQQQSQGGLVVTPQQITIQGAPIASGNAAAIYRGFKAQRQVLADQMSELQDTRGDLARQLEQLPQSAPDRIGIQERIAGIDDRLKAMDKQIAAADAEVARAAAIPGAVVEPPRIQNNGPPEEFYFLSGLFFIIVFLPLSVAFARRIWKRGSQAVVAFPKELAERLSRLEQAADATALEVERIGEGQRFLTRLFTEGDVARALNPPVGAAMDRKIGDAGSSGR